MGKKKALKDLKKKFKNPEIFENIFYLELSNVDF